MDLIDLKNQSETANDTPENAVKFLLNCMYVYQKGGKKGKGEDKALGYMGFVLSKDGLKENKKAESGYLPFATTLQLIKGLREPQRGNTILASMGGTWENNYEDVDPDNYELNITNTQEIAEDQVKIFIKSGGRDNPFPMTLAKNNQGQWKVMSAYFSSIVMDVRPGKATAGDF